MRYKCSRCGRDIPAPIVRGVMMTWPGRLVAIKDRQACYPDEYELCTTCAAGLVAYLEGGESDG